MSRGLAGQRGLDGDDPPQCDRTSGARDYASSVGVVNQTLPLIVNGNNISFAVQIDTVYTFVATLAADRRSFTGTFSGGSCSGTWNGTR